MNVSPELMQRLSNELRQSIFSILTRDITEVARPCAQQDVAEMYVSETGERSSDANDAFDILAVMNPIVEEVAAMKSTTILGSMAWSVGNIRSRYDAELLQEDFTAAPNMRKLLAYLKELCEAKFQCGPDGVRALSYRELCELIFILNELSKTDGKPEKMAVDGNGCYAMSYEKISTPVWLGKDGIEVVFAHDVPTSLLQGWRKIVVEERNGKDLARDTWMMLREKLCKVEENIQIQISDLQAQEM